MSKEEILLSDVWLHNSHEMKCDRRENSNGSFDTESI